MTPQKINTLSLVTSTCDVKTGREQNLDGTFTADPRSYCLNTQNSRIRLVYGKSPHSVRFLEGQIRWSSTYSPLPPTTVFEQGARETSLLLTHTSVSFATRLAHARLPHATNSPLILYNLRFAKSEVKLKCLISICIPREWKTSEIFGHNRQKIYFKGELTKQLDSINFLRGIKGTSPKWNFLRYES